VNRHCKILVAAAALLSLPACANEAQDARPAADTGYDAALAEELGADEYGMRQYIFAMLKTGPKDAEITDPDERSKLFAGHFSNMGVMAEAGQLVLAGPVSGENGERGIFVLNVASVDEAKALMQNDPTIAAGIFTVDFMDYYGSAALMKINEIHGKIQKTTIE